MAEARKVTLKSTDNELFEVEAAVAMESQLIKSLMEDLSNDEPIPLRNVPGKILAKVIEYCKYHLNSMEEGDMSDEDVKSWDRDFLKVDQNTLFDLILAANYLNIRKLLELTCQTVVDTMKGKTPEEIRNAFNIKNDYTAEEEDVRKENAWAFK